MKNALINALFAVGFVAGCATEETPEYENVGQFVSDYCVASCDSASRCQRLDVSACETSCVAALNEATMTDNLFPYRGITASDAASCIGAVEAWSCDRVVLGEQPAQCSAALSILDDESLVQRALDSVESVRRPNVIRRPTPLGELEDLSTEIGTAITSRPRPSVGTELGGRL